MTTGGEKVGCHPGSPLVIPEKLPDFSPSVIPAKAGIQSRRPAIKSKKLVDMVHNIVKFVFFNVQGEKQ